MNAGHIETSERLKHTLSVLMDGKEHSTWDIASQTHSCAVHSDIAALRANGIRVEHRCKGRLHFYRTINGNTRRSRYEDQS